MVLPNRIASVLVTLVTGFQAAAGDFPVSTAEQFHAVLPSVHPGDTIVFKNGEWRDVKLDFRATGTQAKPITLRAETPGKVVLGGSSQLIIDGAHLVVSGFRFESISNLAEIITPHNVAVASVVIFTTNSSRCRLTETAIVNSGTGVSTYVHLRPGSVSNRVDHCFFSNPGAIGVTFYVEAHPARPNHHLVDHNYFGDRKPGRGNRWETIRIGHSEQQDFVSGTTVAQNYFYRCNGENECISNKSTGNRYLHNAFIENRGQLTMRHGDRAWVEGNYFDGGADPNAQGVRLCSADHVVINNYFKNTRDAIIVYNGQNRPEVRGYLAAHNALIAFNTFENCVNNFAIGIGGTGRSVLPRNVRVAHNLVSGKSEPILQMKSPGVEVSYRGNVMFGAPLGIEPAPGIGTNRPPLMTDSWGRIFAGPQANGADADRDWKELSQAVPQVMKDMDGQPRIGAPGAIAGKAGRPLYPVSRTDVGPRFMKQNE